MRQSIYVDDLLALSKSAQKPLLDLFRRFLHEGKLTKQDLDDLNRALEEWQRGLLAAANRSGSTLH